MFLGIKSLEHHSVGGNASVQALSQLVAEKLVKYLQQEGLEMLHYLKDHQDSFFLELNVWPYPEAIWFLD